MALYPVLAFSISIPTSNVLVWLVTKISNNYICQQVTTFWSMLVYITQAAM